MATFNIQVMILVILVVFGMSISGNKNGLVSADMCNVDLNDLRSKCSKYVTKDGPKTDPSKQCCKVIKHLDVPCLCKHVTKGMEKKVSVEKVLHVAKFCGVTVKHGFKCGSYIVP